MADRSAVKRKPKSKARIYLYGITASVPEEPIRVPGVDGQSPVVPIQSAGLVCWISRVPGSIFGSSFSHRMGNLKWRAEATNLHQRAVEQIAVENDILPARFGIVFRSEASLVEHVKLERRAIAAALQKIAGADEWSVRVFAEPQAVEVAGRVRSRNEIQQRKPALPPRRGLRSSDRELASLAKALVKLAADATRRRQVSAGQRNLVWEGSFLVRRSKQTQWQSVLRRFAAQWSDTRRIECSGPWPPYSFVPPMREP